MLAVATHPEHMIISKEMCQERAELEKKML